MLATGLTQHVLTVFLLLLFVSLENQLANGSSGKNEESIDKKYRAVPLRHASSEEYNPFDAHDILKYPNDRTRPSSILSGAYPPTSSVSDKSDSKILSTKSLSFNVAKNFPKLNSIPQRDKNQAEKLYNDCFFGKNCPEQNLGDDWRSYYTVLNSLDNNKNKPDGFLNRHPFLHKNGFPQVDDTPSLSEFQDYKVVGASVPFSIDVNSQKQHGKPDSMSLFPTATRRTRTTTPSSDPSWIKLKPLHPPSAIYDPFSLARNSSNSDELNDSSQFASRIGVEITPESFAMRLGWKDGKYTGPGASKLPSWIEDMNYQNGGYGNMNRRPGGYQSERPSYDDRDDNDRWVKLEAVPVTGVKISKWVPKNTAPSDLPSTSWKYPGKPSWWDRMDTVDNSYTMSQQQPQVSRPKYPQHLESTRWPSRYPQQMSQQQQQQQASDSWSDVIYPNTNPPSATASWSADKGSSGLGWPTKSQGSRYPVATWSASNNNNNRPQQQNYNNQNAYQFQNKPPVYNDKPPYYPDPDGKDEQQWVLISSSKNTQQAQLTNNNNKFPAYGDVPYQFQNTRHSKGLDMTHLNKFNSGVIPSRPQMTQDELFKRTNETLHSLKPALGNRNPQVATSNPPLTQTLIDMLTSTAANMVESTTTKYNTIGIGRSSTPSDTTSINPVGTDPPPTRKKRLMDVNPVYAAIGAGMIPATFGAVLPMVLGRKRRAAEASSHSDASYRSFYQYPKSFAILNPNNLF